MRLLHLLICLARHRPHWRTHQTNERGPFGDWAHGHHWCRACGRQWGLFRMTPPPRPV